MLLAKWVLNFILNHVQYWLFHKSDNPAWEVNLFYIQKLEIGFNFVNGLQIYKTFTQTNVSCSSLVHFCTFIINHYANEYCKVPIFLNRFKKLKCAC